MFAKDEEYARLADKKVQENNLVHYGSGWGALEEMRALIQGDGVFPVSVCFPRSLIGEEQYPWYALLTEGRLPEESPEVAPVSYMVSEKWRKLLEESIRAGYESWYSWLHYGIMLREAMDEEHIASVASKWPLYPEFTRRAWEAFLRSAELTPSVWSYRCLACLAQEKGDDGLAEQYYDKVFSLKAATLDFAFAAEYMGYLNKKEKYEKAWAIYEAMPEWIQLTDRMMLCAAKTAVKLRKLWFLPKVFQREYADIREGETSLTDIWFEYCALRMACDRGLGENIQGEVLERLIDEALETCPPPAAIDFRMSFKRDSRYRMET